MLHWIPSSCGGKVGPPTKGLRLIIRFQRYISDWVETATIVTVAELGVIDEWGNGKASLEFLPHISELRGLHPKELIELPEAYNVVAVGKITEVFKS